MLGSTQVVQLAVTRLVSHLDLEQVRQLLRNKRHLQAPYAAGAVHDKHATALRRECSALEEEWGAVDVRVCVYMDVEGVGGRTEYNHARTFVSSRKALDIRV